MKKKFLAIIGAIGLAFAGAVAVAQVQVPYVTSISNSDAIAVIPRGAPGPSNVYMTALQLQAWLFGGNSQLTGTTAPALTSCGGGTPAISGNDYAGTVTVGTTATGCVVTFNTAYAVAPTCVVTSRTAPGTTTPAYTVSASAITLTQASGSSNLWDYICLAKKGS